MRKIHLIGPLAVALAVASTSCSRVSREEPKPAEVPKIEGRADVTASRDASPLAQGSASAGPYDARFIDAMIPHHEMGVEMGREALARAKRPEIRKLAQDIVTTQTSEIETLRTWRQAWYPGLQPTGTGAMIQTDSGSAAGPGLAAMGTMPASSPDAAQHEGMTGSAAGTGTGTTMGMGMGTSTSSGMGTMPKPGTSSTESATSSAGMNGMNGMSGMKGTSVGGGTSGTSGEPASGDYDRDFLDQMIPHHAQAVDMAQRAQAQAEHQELRELAGRIVQQQQAEIALMQQWQRDWFGARQTAAGAQD